MGELRPYQQAGVHWLRFLSRLGLGACLADDMGLGKTIQVIALLLALKDERGEETTDGPGSPSYKKDSPTNRSTDTAPCLLIVPASLIANWQAEIERFAPSLKYAVAHPSENRAGKDELSGEI